ncbi:hypothetical protein HK100_002086 [Physocladia obscura]|uniref:Carbohydrate kinase PfkB domain-containing protein n=1 Tax=Physocladia obscura TaxID=109957 RepID=A0AAD5XFN5_9FUNG|nr:hypothetical protein HK100_002086 [Physocladia obscura]
MYMNSKLSVLLPGRDTESGNVCGTPLNAVLSAQQSKRKDQRINLDPLFRARSFPHEDAKMRAQSVEKRRGGNGANVLQVLSQFQPILAYSYSPTRSDVQNNKNVMDSYLVSVLAGDTPSAEVPVRNTESSFIVNDLLVNTPNVSLKHCVFRGAGYSEPTAWIIATDKSRTIVNHTTLPELTAVEFKTMLAPTLEELFTLQPSSLWFHFEGRNVSEMEQMVDWLIEVRTLQVAKCEALGWWKSIDGRNSKRTTEDSEFGTSPSALSPITNSALGISPGGNALGKRESKEGLQSVSLEQQEISPHFTISVEFEKPNRPGLDNLLQKADILFFSKWYAEGRGFPNAPTGFLDNIRRECKAGAVLFLTWAEQGCFMLINDPTRPAQTHHIPAPPIYPVDTIGAGDTFAAGVIYGLGLQRWTALSTCEFAVRLATAKCAQVGFDGLAERVL